MHTTREARIEVRIDKWLWAARFFKTRKLATEACKGGHISINNIPCKPAKMIGVGDCITIQKGEETFIVMVKALADKRGSASIAQSLYEETHASINTRAAQREKRKLHAQTPAPSKRPDKRARRKLKQLKQL